MKKEKTIYKDIFKYIAPKGYKFYYDGICFGDYVYESDKFKFDYKLIKNNKY